MFEDAIESACEQINENFKLAAEVDRYVIDLGGDALKFSSAVWDVSMILAAVVFAIVACYELYAQAVRTEARGGPMGSAEVVFKVMFRVAVCFLLLQVSFEILINLYKTSNALTEAIGNISYGSSFGKDVIDVDAIIDRLPGGLSDILAFLLVLVVVFFSWAAKLAALVLILIRMIQVYLYIAVAPIPLATFPSSEYNQIAKSFLKSFVAVCIQGTLIYLVVRFLPALVSTAIQSDLFIKGDSLIAAMSVAMLYSIAILVTLVGTQQLSRRICGAM